VDILAVLVSRSNLAMIVACSEVALFSGVNFSQTFLGFNRRRGGPYVSRKDSVHRGLPLVVLIQVRRPDSPRGSYSSACQLGLEDCFHYSSFICKVKPDRSQAVHQSD
jgi:hypothetical protein